MAKRILIVDDDQDFRYSAGIALKRAGYKIVAASSGPEALSILRSGRRVRFDLLLLDIIMPEMSGIELVEEMSRTGNSVPVLVLSGVADDHLFKGLINKERTYFLDEPYDPHEMVRRVASILGRGHSKKGVVNHSPDNDHTSVNTVGAQQCKVSQKRRGDL